MDMFIHVILGYFDLGTADSHCITIPVKVVRIGGKHGRNKMRYSLYNLACHRW